MVDDMALSMDSYVALTWPSTHQVLIDSQPHFTLIFLFDVELSSMFCQPGLTSDRPIGLPGPQALNTSPSSFISNRYTANVALTWPLRDEFSSSVIDDLASWVASTWSTEYRAPDPLEILAMHFQ